MGDVFSVAIGAKAPIPVITTRREFFIVAHSSRFQILSGIGPLGYQEIRNNSKSRPPGGPIRGTQVALIVVRYNGPEMDPVFSRRRLLQMAILTALAPRGRPVHAA